MTLLTTVFAAVICTAIWYKNAPRDEMNLGFLCLMFWGGSLMWLVDACFEYAELGAACFIQSPETMLNDLFLGLSAVAFGLTVWLVTVLVKDPRKVLHKLIGGRRS